MKTNDLIKTGLTKEQAQNMIEIYKKEIKGYIPKTRLDEVIKERNALKNLLIEKDKQFLALHQTIKEYEGLSNRVKQLNSDQEIVQGKLVQSKKSLMVAIEIMSSL
jgi:hypothetical protein